MRCPNCAGGALSETLTKNGVLIDVCATCHGVWLDKGEVYLFSRRPRELERKLAAAATNRRPGERLCPHCETAMEVGPFLQDGIEVDACPDCEGLWFDGGELRAAVSADRHAFLLETEPLPSDAVDDDIEASAAAAAAAEKAEHRARDLAAGLLPLPNLWLRSLSAVVLLYAFLGLILISMVEFGLLRPVLALAIGGAIIVLQFVLGPQLMDLSLRWLYKFDWAPPESLPEHLREFLTRVCAEQNMKVPSIGLIHDGAPNAFTYGYSPNTMRVVFTQGILDLLEPNEVEAVVAHELGHGKNWDMLLMTVVQLVPLLLFYVYRTLLGGGGKKDNAYTTAVAVGAYVLYIVSEYVVLWFSRCREYYADRFAGRVTGQPNALASALVKIGYGLAARGEPQEEQGPGDEADAKAKKKARKKASGSMLDALGALGIFDRKAAVAMVAASASGGTHTIGVENLKSAMQWDLWNPWATFHELNSTHPLIAHRLQYLSDQAASLGQRPFVIFDRRKPESYWDEFLVDVAVMFLPLILFLAGLVAAGALVGLNVAALAAGRSWLAFAGLPVLGLGVGMLIKTLCVYRGHFFAPLTVAGLLHKVKVSAVRPVPARVKGTIIGKGVPGLIWSDDFVIQDRTGILFLDYHQPLRIWNWLFGLLRAGSLQGREIEAKGWFRRSPVPYLELKSFIVDGVERNCYAYPAKLVFALGITAVGAALVAAGFLA